MSNYQTLKLNKMKKIVFVLIAILSISSLVAQGPGRGKGQMRQGRSADCNNTCVNDMKSELVKQQSEFYSLLNAKDKSKIEGLKAKLTELRKNMTKDSDVEQSRAFRDEIYKIRKDAEKIADKYPEQSKKYTSEIVNFQKNCNNNFNGRGKSFKGKGKRDGNSKANNRNMHSMKKMNDAAWLLLWDENTTQSMMGMRSQQNGMRRNNMKFMKDIPEEAKVYAKENIFPIMAEKRKAFDKILNDTEKKEIETARGMIMSRDAMVKNWRESEDFVPGERRNDPAFDSFREQMQKSMQAVRTIAIEHNDEIQAILDDLKPQTEKWKNDMKKLMSDNDRKGNRRNFKGGSEEMRFLLLNPEMSETLRFF